MSLENNNALEDPKDYTRHIWIGILVVVVAMIAVIAMQGDQIPSNSEVTTKHILIQFSKADPADRARALKRIQEIRQRILSGESFESLARQYSDDPGSAARGGFIPPQPRGTFEKNYDAYAWSADLDTLGEIIQTSHGFHLVVVTKRYISPADEYEQELDRRVSEERSGNRGSDSEEDTDK
ncbi:MAG: peptidyl-prolyl cis-trans isomerase [Candidatus Hydrogenedentes bacterium]|nr:peptidyl-prolyl cis-trans isomerase [Candidatus Hydrogenedentota bacterium]